MSKELQMFESPHFEFDWGEIYREWQAACEEYSIDPQIFQLIEYDLDACDGDFDVFGEYDWVPAGSGETRIAPKKKSAKGYTYYLPRFSKASGITLMLILDNLTDEELVANAWILACALQLEADFPAYWRGIYNRSFLESFVRFCKGNLGDKLGYGWGLNSKRFFPNKYFSTRLLETVDFLTVSQLVRLAALNARYYLDKWIVVRYTVGGLPLEEYRNTLELQIEEQSWLVSGKLVPRGHKEAESRQGANPTRVASGHCGKPKLLVSNGRQGEFREGKRRQSRSETIERNATARRICLEHYGPTCVVCGMNFEEAFGEKFAGIIDVHHIAPISQYEGDHLVDPIEDMVPLCPNCHRMIHRKGDGVYLPDELKRVIAGQRDLRGE